jgi:hypothetical protein
MIAEAVKFTTTNACTGFRTKTPQEVHRITTNKILYTKGCVECW